MKTFAHLLSLLLLAFVASAQVPQQLSYQGRVTVAGQNFDGTGQFKFALVNAAGTTTLWSHDGTSAGGNAPASSLGLIVTKGLYSVHLGLTNPIAPSLFQTNANVRLRVWFDDGVHGSQQLTPDQPLAASAWALVAETANEVKAGSVSMASLSPELQTQINGLLAWQTANKPVIVGPLTINAAEDTFFSAGIAITGATTASVTGAPPGISYDFGTQTLSGTPPPQGPFTFLLTATNIAGSTTATVTLNVGQSIYVDVVTGLDTNAGTSASPVKTAGKGIELAAASVPKRSVRVSKGSYILPSALLLADGVNVFGQYDQAAGWSRSPSNTTTLVNTNAANGHMYAVQAADLTLPTKLDGFSIIAGNATSPGASSYGVAARGCTALTLSNNVITANNGNAGANGGNGTSGASGSVGSNGADALNNGGGGVGGGPAGVAGSGGKGGLGASPVIQNAQPGVGPFAGVAGNPVANGGNGGSAPDSTAHGTGGAGGSAGSIIAATLTYQGAPGASGVTGVDGSRGGGGGGGGGGDFFGEAVRGGGGGQGGGGGLGGGGGQPGAGGGGSFAVFVATGSVSVINCSLVCGAGGKGGNGGSGVLGGAGAAGGTGGAGQAFDPQNNISGNGGNGGSGGKGASGGGGGGGSGGPAICIAAMSGTTITQSGNAFTLTTTGGGGAGGSGPIGNSGQAGSAGIIQTVKLDY